MFYIKISFKKWKYIVAMVIYFCDFNCLHIFQYDWSLHKEHS